LTSILSFLIERTALAKLYALVFSGFGRTVAGSVEEPEKLRYVETGSE